MYTYIIVIINCYDNFKNKPTIDIFEEDVIHEQPETEKNEEYELKPLTIGDGYTIENREEDNYINVTNLCKAGGKQFKHWNQLERTKAFLQVLSSTVGIPSADLIKLGYIRRWISPDFDVKVSGWIYEVVLFLHHFT